jgi:hypothetical protein
MGMISVGKSENTSKNEHRMSKTTVFFIDNALSIQKKNLNLLKMNLRGIHLKDMKGKKINYLLQDQGVGVFC